MTPQEAAALIGKPVKVRRQWGTPGFHTGRLDAIAGDEAAVLLRGHGYVEWVPVSCIRRWRKGESLQSEQRGRLPK